MGPTGKFENIAKINPQIPRQKLNAIVGKEMMRRD